MIRYAIAVGALLAASGLLAMAGCDEQPPEPAPRQGNVTDRPATPPDDDAAGGDQSADVDGDGPTDPPTDDDGAGPAEPADDAADPASGLEGERLRHYVLARREAIDALLRRGEIARALNLARDLQSRYPQFGHALRLTYQVRQLRQRKNEAAPLGFVIDRLDEPTAAEYDAVFQRFRRGGETSLLMLAHAAATRDDATAAQAIRLLDELGRGHAAGACARRLVNHPETNLRQRCVGLIAQRLDTLDALGLQALYQAAVTQKDRPEARQLRLLAARRLNAGLEAEALQSLLVRATSPRPVDTRAEQNNLIALLGALYHFAANRSDAAFTEMVGDDQALAQLRQAAGQVGGPVAMLFEPIDLSTLDEGMSFRWVFGTAKWPVLPADVEAEVEAQAVAVGRERSAKLVTGPYAIAAWVRPEALPVADSDRPFHVIARKGGWAMALLVDASGSVVFMHVVQPDGQAIVTRSQTRLEPGTWRHVVASLDPEAGRMTLYVDGEAEASAEFAAGSEIVADANPARPFEVLGLEPRELGPTRLDGDVEDLRFYQRPLRPALVRQLHTLAHAWQAQPSGD